MANLLKYSAGSLLSGLTWANCGFTLTDFNSLANGSCVVASSEIDNATSLDLMLDVSFSLTVGGTTAAGAAVALFMLPKNQDGSTYGDGTASGSTPPTGGYQRGVATVRVGITSGNAVTGIFERIRVPPGAGKLVLANYLGVALNASASAAIKARAYTFTTNG